MTERRKGKPTKGEIAQGNQMTVKVWKNADGSMRTAPYSLFPYAELVKKTEAKAKKRKLA